MDRTKDVETIRTLTVVLDRAVRDLADAGRPVEASRLAARAWSSLRIDHPDRARQLERALHHLARREAELEAELEANAR